MEGVRLGCGVWVNRRAGKGVGGSCVAWTAGIEGEGVTSGDGWDVPQAESSKSKATSSPRVLKELCGLVL